MIALVKVVLFAYLIYAIFNGKVRKIVSFCSSQNLRYFSDLINFPGVQSQGFCGLRRSLGYHAMLP